MKLVLIYGPPAVGKLTVAKELSRYTGFKLYHNHVSIQEVESIFEFGTPPFWKLVGKFRNEMIKTAVKERIDTIFTLVYAKHSDDEYVTSLRRLVESSGGRVCFVRLYCSKEKLLERVENGSRNEFGKLTSREELQSMFERFDLFGRVTGARSLSIDTSNCTPRKAALRIASHYGLPNEQSSPRPHNGL